MTLEQPTTTDGEFYSVERLKFLLAIYPTLGFSKPPKDPEIRVKITALFGEASWAEASTKAADIERAIRWLNEKDWRAAYTVRASYIVGLSLRDIRDYLGRQGVHVSHDTVNRWRKDGLVNMSAFLCGKVF